MKGRIRDEIKRTGNKGEVKEEQRGTTKAKMHKSEKKRRATRAMRRSVENSIYESHAFSFSYFVASDGDARACLVWLAFSALLRQDLLAVVSYPTIELTFILLSSFSSLLLAHITLFKYINIDQMHASFIVHC